MEKYPKSKERSRSKARRLIGKAYECAVLAGGLIGAERGTMRIKGMAFIRRARDTWQALPIEMSIAAQSALYPNDTRLASRLANIRAAKCGYSVKCQW